MYHAWTCVGGGGGGLGLMDGHDPLWGEEGGGARPDGWS